MFQKTSLVLLLMVCLSACFGKKGQKGTTTKESVRQNTPLLEGVFVIDVPDKKEEGQKSSAPGSK